MTSPFPGMDPFLEHPAFFPGLHDRLIAYLGEMLQAKLPEPYYAEIGDRLWVEVSDRRIAPDVYVLSSGKGPTPPVPGGVAIADQVRSRPIVVTVPHDEVREPFLQVYTRLEGERLVTTIEVLSLSNKTPGAHGRELYLKKQREILESQSNLVEIDFLRAGVHTTAVPRDLAEQRGGPFDYHVCVHRFDNLEDYFVYPARLEDSLPEIAVPLLGPGESVGLDLQAAFQRAYEAGPYRRRLEYTLDACVPPIDGARVAWAKSLLARRHPT